MGEENSRKRPIELDWSVILDSKNDDAEPPPIVIVKKPTFIDSSPLPSATSAMSAGDPSPREDIVSMTDRALEELIKRQRGNLDKLGRTLPDKGAKLCANIRNLEEERERRKLRRPRIDVDECEKPVQSNGSNMIGASNGFKVRQRSPSPQTRPQSEFGAIFSKKIEENAENTDCKIVNGFDRGSSVLGPQSTEGMRSSNGLPQRRIQKQWPFSSSSIFPHNRDKSVPSNGDRKGGASSPHPHGNKQEISQKSSSKNWKDICAVQPSAVFRSRKEKTLVLLDEDDSQLQEKMERTKELSKCINDAKIYYPSRDDPESVEIVGEDINCLAPQAFLTSPIMNFYIRYLQLQESSRNKARHDSHFFNTFFYKKLEQAVSYKGSDKESFFLKFRRWWKGVNIFQKAYVLIPIHEEALFCNSNEFDLVGVPGFRIWMTDTDWFMEHLKKDSLILFVMSICVLLELLIRMICLHWSLVIICIPEKGDESGPIILHLDSLRFHSSRSVFHNVKSYLREEWNYMNQEVVLSDLPIADKIWKNLPRRIEEQVIAVPQQKNDYDCGLFVLYFMERFIEEAPQRLKRRDLEMFGRQWFRPEEASSLREKIRNLLLDEFENASKNLIVSESPRCTEVASP